MGKAPRSGAPAGRPGNDPRFRAARRITVADAEGRFRFSALRPGTYLLRSTVTWKASGNSVVQGGVVAGLVTVGTEEPREFVLHQVYPADSTALLVVAMISAAERGARRSRTLGRISGSSCDTEWEEPARKELVLEAGRRGADAVAGVVWRPLREGAGRAEGEVGAQCARE